MSVRFCLCILYSTLLISFNLPLKTVSFSAHPVLSGSSSTTPTPVGSDDVVSSSVQPSAAETVRLLQSASAAASASAGGGGGGEGEGGGGTAAVAEGEEDENMVTTIDEVCVCVRVCVCVCVCVC